jgi:hypothetical protein
MAILGKKVEPAPWREGQRGGSTSGFTRRQNLSGDGEQTMIKNCGTCGGQYTGASCSHPAQRSRR